ncbi:hypothetical protein ASC94_20325 [Massilia sp. Root418]|nr:hypothetical protein ASC94_20325 [Massilia sp. Root418]
MSITPPFDPPYKMSTVLADGSVQWMEVRADGSMVEASAPAVMLPAADAPAPRAGQSSPSGQSARAVTVLNVPFAEKDEAKQLGARWDPKRRKWYIPAGVDAAPFSRWTGAGN